MPEQFVDPKQVVDFHRYMQERGEAPLVMLYYLFSGTPDKFLQAVAENMLGPDGRSDEKLLRLLKQRFDVRANNFLAMHRFCGAISQRTENSSAGKERSEGSVLSESFDSLPVSDLNKFYYQLAEMKLFVADASSFRHILCYFTPVLDEALAKFNLPPLPVFGEDPEENHRICLQHLQTLGLAGILRKDAEEISIQAASLTRQ